MKTFLPSINAEIDRARAIFALIKNDPAQGRAQCIWNEVLADVAEARILSMAKDGWHGHTDPQGRGANWWARSFGYVLPDWYGDESNNIESLNRGGWGNVDNAMKSWLGSPAHARHILGQGDFFAAQIHIGVAYLHDEASESKHYWCVLSAP